jgi:excisionase family DNA binding protein
MAAARAIEGGSEAAGSSANPIVECVCGTECGETFGAPLIDIAELARLLATSPRHVRRLVEEHRVPYLKIGHYVRFDPVDISQWIEGQKVTTAVDGGGDDRPLWVRLSQGEGHGRASASRPRQAPTVHGGERGDPLWVRNRAVRER